MTTGKTDETEGTCGHQTSSRASFTALSTIAIQAGLTQIVASVLKSGSLIHLQLVQFQPGLCEIGSNREENLILIQEQQQLLDKLQKHEPEVLAVVEKKQQEKLRVRRDGRRKQKEEEEGLTEAMKASLSEGWSLLLRLLERRLEVLKLASDFYLRVAEFAVSIGRLEDLQIKADEDKLNEVHVSYNFMRKDLLGKSLQVLTSSSILLQRLKQLQRTEALQRRGKVLQPEEEEVEECSQYSRGPVLRLEELVESLQDRRRRADQAFRQQLQQAEADLKKRANAEDLSLLNVNLRSGSTSNQTVDLEPEGTSESKKLKSGSTSDLQSTSWSEHISLHQQEVTEDGNLEHGSKLQESGQEPDVKPDSCLDLNTQSRFGSLRDLLSESRSAEARNHSLGSISDLKLISGSENTRTLRSVCSSDLQTESRLDLKTESGSQNTKESLTGFRSDQGTRPIGFRSGSANTKKLHLESKTVKTSNPLLSFKSVLKTRSRSDELFISESDVKPGETTETLSEIEEVSTKSASLQQPRCVSEKTRNLLTESIPDLQTGSWLGPKTEPESQNSKDSHSGFRSDPKNRSKSELQRSGSEEGKDVRAAFTSDETIKQQLESRSVVRSRSEEQHTSGCDRKPESASEKIQNQLTGSSAEGIRNLKLRGRSEIISERVSETAPLESASIEQDVQTGSRLDQNNQSRSDVPRSGSSPRSGSERTSKQNDESKTEETKDSDSLKTRSRSEERQICRSGSEEAETQQTESRPEVSGSGSEPLSLKHQLREIKLGLEGQTHHQMEVQQHQGKEMFSSGNQERLKTLQDLKCVSEMLDSCTRMDLGSELQTSRLLEHFKQAEPHLRQLDAKVQHTMRSWQSLRGVQANLEEVKGGAVKEEDLSELLKLQQAVKNKAKQSESILKLSSGFHLAAKQLEVLLQSEPTSPVTGSTGLHGSREAELSRLQEAQKQIQNLLKTMSTTRKDICAAVSQSSWAGFQVEQLEVRLGSLDSLCESWLKKAAQCEEELRREQLTHVLHEDINQLRESFKELKKRFSNTKFNYLKRNDRTRNLKAVWNQLQQMEAYQEKLQGLGKRVHSAAARLGSEVKNTNVGRQLEDAVNELQRQMGQLERNISEHKKTLDMTCRLQHAMEEYQFWCEEASATIARVGKFSLECRSTEAISVLYRQFEKFVRPTVPQQEERISQITELAVRLHGVEEGQRYIEKTVSKHSEMMESIRELSNGLMELEAKLKMENVKQQQKDEENEVEEDGEREQRRQTGEKEKMTEKRRMKQRDNRSTQEAADMHELKETGHTPELITEKDREEAPAANRKPPLEKSQSQGVNGQTPGRELLSGKFISSLTSTHTLTVTSPMDAKRQVRVTHNQSQATKPQAPPSESLIGTSLPDNQEEFHKEMEEVEQNMASSFQETSPHVELLQPEVVTEDCFSNDEYDCASPDDISLPPLAETPDSHMFQSDVEEGFCFSSHSVLISQVSHQCHAQSEPTGIDPVPQQKEASQMESYPAPTVSLHSSTRFRSESRSCKLSPSTVPVTTLFTSTLCTILKTKESSSDLSLSHQVHGYNTTVCSKDKNAPENRSPYTRPTQDLSQSLHQQSFNGSDNGLHNLNTPKRDAGVQNVSSGYTKTDNILPDQRLESEMNQDIKPHRTSREATPQKDSVVKTSLVSHQNICIKSSFVGNHCTNPKDCSNLAQENTDPVPKSEPSAQISSIRDAVLHKDVTQSQGHGLLQSSTTITQSSTTPSNPSQKFATARNRDLDAPCPVRDICLRTTTKVTQQSVFDQSFPSGRSQTDTTSNQDPRDPPEDLVHSQPQPKSISNINICRSKQSLQTVYPFQESVTSNHTQQCVHGPGMSPSSAQSAPPHPKPQTHPSPHRANPHAAPSDSPPHVLTPSQDPSICQPIAIREEIRLTPQIQGRPLPPARLPQLPSESLPLGKASEPGLPRFTRPGSQATVMEGSPVTLEVEVMGNQEPRLTRFKHEEVSPCSADQNQERTCCLQDSQRSTGSSSGGASVDKWLLLEAFDIIKEDWNTWFGTLCVLLWLLYLILL